MPRKEYDDLPHKLECIENGHLFTAQVRKKLHYVDGVDAPVLATVPAGALDNIRCTYPGCNSLVREAQG
jgi:hypothetical protein